MGTRTVGPSRSAGPKPGASAPAELEDHATDAFMRVMGWSEAGSSKV